MKTTDQLIDDLLNLAFAEDVGDGDHTTLSTIPADETGRQRLIVKEEGILAGVEIAAKVFAKFDPELKMTVYINDGSHVRPGDIAFVVEGKVRSLLQTERVMLIADECWMMIDPKCPQSLEFMRNAEKRSRKYEGSVVVATQQIVDFLDHQIELYGRSVLDLPSIKLIFGMNGQDFKEVKQIFSLNNAQGRIIEAQQRGIALMCAGAEKFRIRFDLSSERLKMFGTGGGR